MFNREPQVEIPSEGCKTALGSGGRYFTTAEGVVYVTDPPIEVHLLSLERDFPGWEEVVPWRVILRPRKLLEALREEKSAGRFKRTGCLGDLLSNSRPPHSPRRLRDLEWLLNTIGRSTFRMISRVPESAGRFLLAWLCHRDLGYRQLLSARPMLAALLARSLFQAEREDDLTGIVDRCKNWTRRPLEVISEGLGFPADCLAGLGKITLAGSEVELAPALQRALQDAQLRKTFNHVKAIGPDGVRLFANADLRRCVDTEFLHLLSSSDRTRLEPAFVPLLESTVFLLNDREFGLGKKKFTSPDQLAAWYLDAFPHFSPVRVRELMHLRFPRAPIDGIPGVIEQIADGRRLMLWAAECRNCVATPYYVDELRRRGCFLFSAGGMGLRKCTIRVDVREEWQDSVPFVITEIAGMANGPVPAQTLAAIRHWAADQSLPVHIPDDAPQVRQLLIPGAD